MDPHVYYRGPFKDVTIVHVSVEDVDEPPLFDSPAYLVELPEDAEMGTVVKTVSARDPDAANNTVRWGTHTHCNVSIRRHLRAPLVVLI